MCRKCVDCQLALQNLLSILLLPRITISLAYQHQLITIIKSIASKKANREFAAHHVSANERYFEYTSLQHHTILRPVWWPHGDTHARASTICSIIYRRNIMVVWNATDFLSLTPIECRAPPVLIPSVCHTGLPRLSRGTRSTVEPPNVGSRYGKGRQRAGQPTTAPTATANVAANERTVAKTSSLVQAFSTVLRLVRWTTLSRSCVASCSGDSVCVGTGSGVERDSDLAAASETRKRILAGLKGLKLPDWPTVVIGIALSTRLGRGVVYERCRTP